MDPEGKPGLDWWAEIAGKKHPWPEESRGKETWKRVMESGGKSGTEWKGQTEIL